MSGNSIRVMRAYAKSYSWLAINLAALVILFAAGTSLAQTLQTGFAQRNVNTAGLTPTNSGLYAGNPLKQINEPFCINASVNKNVVVCGSNDYSGVDDPGLGDSWVGLHWSTDAGQTFNRGLLPCHLYDSCSVGAKYAADPNLSEAPGALFYSFIGGWRNGEQRSGMWMTSHYYTNGETGMPYRFRRIDEIALGTGGEGPGGKFLDKPGQALSLAAPGTQPDVDWQIPAWTDPTDPSRSVEAHTLSIPAGSLHFTFSVFTGNDNNPGTKIQYYRYDNWDFTAPAVVEKLSEGVEINQGTSIATRNNGKDVMVVWRRFSDDPKVPSAIVYTLSTRHGARPSKPQVLAELCGMDQPTGRARYRASSLPIVTSDEDKFLVFYADKSEVAGRACTDNNGVDHVNVGTDGNPDTDVLARLDYSRIRMATWDGKTKSQGEAAWDFQLVDPRLDGNGHRLPGHQLTPAATTAGGITTVVWDDNKDSVLYRAAPQSFFDSPRPFVQDYVLTQEFGLIPSSAYEDPANDLPEGKPFRQSVDIWGVQVQNSAPGQAFKVSRYARGLVRGADGSRTVQQLEYNFPNGRLFRQGSRPFFADYKTVAAAAWRLVASNGQAAWDSNADEPAPGSNAFFQAPVFYAGFTDNRGVRGDVYYNGCDENDPAANCSNEYALPNPPPAMTMAPLEGEEDPSRLGICTADSPTALSRNQSVYVAAIRPGIALTVVSARKPDNGKRGYALYAQNSTSTPKELVLSVPDSAEASFDRDTVATDDSTFSRSLTVNVPPFSGSVRTVFVFGEDGDPQLIPVTATDSSGALEPVFTTLNGSVDSPLLNVEVGGVSVVDSEVYNLSLLPTRVISNQDFENQDFENTGFLQDFENSVILQDFENETLLQDFENTTVLQDFENQDFENAVYQAQDFENAGELQDFENQDFENQAFVLQDFENVPELQDFENQDFENFNILYQDFENQDFENSPPTGEVELNEYSWTVNGDNNTTAGFNIKPLASPGSLDGVRTQLIVSKTSYNLTVAQNPVLETSGLFCTPQYVAQNQIVYSKITEDSGSIGNVVADPGLDPETASFFLAPGEKAVVTLRVYGPPVNVGVGVWAQADDEVTDCTAEVGGGEVDPACEVDFLDVDETPPEIVVLGANPQIVEAGAGAYSDPNPAATASDDRDGDITGSILVDTSGVDTTMPGAYLVTYTVQDLEGNSASATRAVNVVDTTAPLLTLPADVLFEATAPDSSIDIGLASATDFVGPVTIVSDAPALFPLGTTVVTWTATDDFGNTSMGTQNVVVQDSTPPALIGAVPPNPLLVEANDASGWVYSVPLMPLWQSISYADAVSGTIGAVCSPTATSNFPLDDTEVTCSAIDGAGNAGVPVSFTVTVQDTTGPTLPDFPGGFDSEEPFVVQFDQSTFTLEWGPFDVNDTDPMLDVSCSVGSPVPNAPLYTFDYDFPVGTTEVTCTATDSSGNEVSGSFIVNVADETGPVFTIDETALVVTTAGTTASVDYLANISASDVVDGPIDDTDLVCTVDGEARPNPFDFALGTASTVSCTATDDSDNSTTASFTVAVNYIYGIVIEPLKGNISAGSTVPVDWYYVNPETGNRVNTPTISPSVEWFGTFSERNCAGTNSGDNDGAEDAGSSRVRYTSSDSSWRLNWQTPPTAGWYELVIAPPGTDEATVCVRTR